MKSSRPFKSAVVAAVLATGLLTACGTSPPPADELANEIVDTLEDANGQPVSDAVKACMHEKIDTFELTDEQAQGFDDLDDVANKAADGNAEAIAIMDEFEADLASCNSR